MTKINKGKRIGVIYNIYSACLLYSFMLIMVFIGACFAINFGRAKDNALQVWMLYILFAISAMGLSVASWVVLKKSKYATTMLFKKFKPYNIGLVMASIILLSNIAFWGVASMGIAMFSYSILAEQVVYINMLFFLTTDGVLGFIGFNILSAISLSALAIGSYTKKHAWGCDLLLIVGMLIVSFTGQTLPTIIVFSIAVFASVANFIYASSGRVNYEKL